MLVIPMVNHMDEIIGVIQLINRKRISIKKLTVKEMKSHEVIVFSSKDADLVKAMAGQAAVAINNQRLMEDQRMLFRKASFSLLPALSMLSHLIQGGIVIGYLF